MLAARAAGGGGGGGRALGEHPKGGPVTVRAGRFGAYVNWGKVNATIPKSTPPESITLSEALELLAERGDRPAKGGKAKKPAPRKAAAKAAKKPAEKPAAAPRKAAAKKAPAQKAAAKKAPPPKPPAKSSAAKTRRKA